MRRLSLLCATAFIAVTALAATSPAEAAFHVIRWHDTGFCQVWDEASRSRRGRRTTPPSPTGSRPLSGRWRSRKCWRASTSARF